LKVSKIGSIRNIESEVEVVWWRQIQRQVRERPVRNRAVGSPVHSRDVHRGVLVDQVIGEVVRTPDQQRQERDEGQYTYIYSFSDQKRPPSTT
jgi:hypothetical protein